MNQNGWPEPATRKDYRSTSGGCQYPRPRSRTREVKCPVALSILPGICRIADDANQPESDGLTRPPESTKNQAVTTRAGSESVALSPSARSCFLSMVNLALVSEQRGRIRDLAGFRRSHRLPDEFSERAQAFVRRIAAEDIGDDLDQRFSDFRRQLGLKRVDMEVSEPHDGSGTITTPQFQYQVSVALCEDDLNSVVWRRRVCDFAAPDPVLSSDFAAAFGTVFDTVEFTPVDPIDVESFIDWIEDQSDSHLEPDYDRTGTWCRLLAAQQQTASMLVEHHQVSLQSLSPCSPERLLRSFLAFQKLLPAIAWAG